MSRTNRRIPHGESWTCTGNECCHDERCERWTWAVTVVTVLAFVAIGIAAVFQAF